MLHGSFPVLKISELIESRAMLMKKYCQGSLSPRDVRPLRKTSSLGTINNISKTFLNSNLSLSIVNESQREMRNGKLIA